MELLNRAQQRAREFQSDPRGRKPRWLEANKVEAAQSLRSRFAAAAQTTAKSLRASLRGQGRADERPPAPQAGPVTSVGPSG